ncbi:MAG: tRNA (N6-threonylcarbamoyladenosine(37)-N6)-methyltransferase TrmO [Candidatus Aminicenantes bacterium]|jgi:tRNA-Thr(GGU) m(6)t(6)A37 methyltransferase TsaA|nr:tRNA (N6-threonylcarbamoyladenosine(37)-N6)-methyltransferase TrmO [Candidatus Aminicenantes bacterium]
MAFSFNFSPIGIVRSPFKTKDDIPLERNAAPNGFDDVKGKIEIFEEFSAGLKDIDEFSHLIVIFAFHQAGEGKLLSQPPFDDRLRGAFASRSPHRPNPLGMTIVRLRGRNGNTLKISGLDMIEGTPVLDIKPYTRKDRKPDIKTGWMEKYEK